MSTIFLGTSEFAAAVLERLARSERHRPLLVLTRPDRPAGRGRRLTSPPVADAARELGLALAQPQSVNDEPTRQAIASFGRGPSEPATVIVCAFGALIKQPLLSQQPMLNVHPSLLPRWRGAAPVERAIMAGDQRTGVSIMRLTEGLDSGPVCLAESIPIEPRDTYGTLAARLERLGGELLLRALDESPPFVEQPDEGVTYAEKIGPEDRTLDPVAAGAIELERTVRALTPHIGARLALDGGAMLGVRDALAHDSAPMRQGLYERDGRLMLGCREGELELLEVQPAGGRPMDGSAYLRGHGLPGG
jgi:methionyl-tRNA formyltransferase